MKTKKIVLESDIEIIDFNHKEQGFYVVNIIKNE